MRKFQEGRNWLHFAKIIGIALLILAAIFVFAKNGTRWYDQAKEHDWSINPISITVSAVLLLVSLWLTPLGWIWLVKDMGSNASAADLRAAWFTSQLSRYVPGKIWLFAGRAAYLRYAGLSYLNSVSIPVLELLYTFGSAAFVSLVVLAAFGAPMLSDTIKTALIIGAAIFLLLPLLSPIQRSLIRLKLGKRQESSEYSPLGLPTTIRLIALFSVLWVSRGLALYLWLVGSGFNQIDLAPCIIAAPLAWMAGYIVFFAPGGLGVREATMVSMLAQNGNAGPMIVVIAGHRLLLSLGEMAYALHYFRNISRFLGNMRKTRSLNEKEYG